MRTQPSTSHAARGALRMYFCHAGTACTTRMTDQQEQAPQAASIAEGLSTGCARAHGDGQPAYEIYPRQHNERQACRDAVVYESEQS